MTFPPLYRDGVELGRFVTPSQGRGFAFLTRPFLLEALAGLVHPPLYKAGRPGVHLLPNRAGFCAVSPCGNQSEVCGLGAFQRGIR